MGKYREFMKRADDSKNQCQASTARGQCENAKMPGSDYCPAHGGNRGYNSMRNERRRLYDVERYKKKIAKLTDHEDANSFREEIGVMRMMLETRLNQCTDDHTLMLHSQVISSLIMNIERAITSATKLELQLGKVLTEEQAGAWITDLIEIVGRHITDPEVLEGISDELLQSLEDITAPRRESGDDDL